jgi:hypothetical protein
MARPTVTGVAAGNGKARTSAVIVLTALLDERRRRGTALFETAKQRATVVLSTLWTATRWSSRCRERRPGQPGVRPRPAFVRERVAGASPGLAYADRQRAREAFRALDGARHPNREVHVISDFQHSAWDGLEGTRAPAGVGVYLHPVGEEPPPNAWIDSIDFSGQILEKGTPIEFRVVVASGPTHPRSDVEVEMEIDGRVVDRRHVDLAPGSRVALSLRQTFAKDGPHLGTVRWRSDRARKPMTAGASRCARRRRCRFWSSVRRSRGPLPETALAPPGSTSTALARPSDRAGQRVARARGRILLADVSA